MKHTAQKIEEAKEARAAQSKKKRKHENPENRKNSGKKKRTLPEAARPYMFKPGQSGNPGGRPKNDVAAELARAVIEGNFEAAAAAFAKQLRKGNAYALSVLADRGYGKVKDRVALENPDGSPLALTVKLVRPTLKDLK